MGMMGCSRLPRNCLRMPLESRVWSRNAATCCMPSLHESVARSKPNSSASGSNPVNRKPWPNWQRTLAKYSKHYPEAVRRLAEEEEKTCMFYEFPREHGSAYLDDHCH